jgi:hypothetical protein
MKKSYFYFISQGEFTISDREFCAESERTFDMPLFELANNRSILNLLGLVYLDGRGPFNLEPSWDSAKRADWFINYLDAFSDHKQKERFAKMETNPTIRLLVINKEMAKKIIRKD